MGRTVQVRQLKTQQNVAIKYIADQLDVRTKSFQQAFSPCLCLYL
jgi:hypothetical protein